MKKSLIALAVLSAGLMAAAGENGSDTGGAGTGASSASPPPPPAPAKLTKARVLTDCELGKANDLVELPAEAAKAGKEAGTLDVSKGAVDYAATLPQNQPKPQT